MFQSYNITQIYGFLFYVFLYLIIIIKTYNENCFPSYKIEYFKILMIYAIIIILLKKVNKLVMPTPKKSCNLFFVFV